MRMRWAWMDLITLPLAAVMLAPLLWNLVRIVLQYFDVIPTE